MADPGDTVLVLAAWRRPQYLARVLESWALVPEVASLRRIVAALGPSPREAEQRAVLARFPLDIEVRPDSPECLPVPGSHRALGEAVTAVFAGDDGCRFVIMSDEDVLVSDDVLRYFGWARDLRGDDGILCVCAHNSLGQGWHRPQDDSGADQAAVRLASEFNPWCWGTWRDRWEGVIEPDWDYDCSPGPFPDSERGYDWQMWRLVQRGWLSAVPDASRSQNIGQHEGVYALPDRFGGTQAASFREHRGEVAYWLAP